MRDDLARGIRDGGADGHHVRRPLLQGLAGPPMTPGDTVALPLKSGGHAGGIAVTTIGSLFSGIGGLELGMGRSIPGAHVAWQVDQDPFCREVLAKHWPGADRSVTDVRAAGHPSLTPVDVVCGGFPCQDISLAGKGAGLAGERSGLWFEFARIIGELRPRVVVVENVAALVARGLDRVLADLAALGFDAEWSTVRASDVGAPHKRERLFVVAWRVSDTERDDVRQEPRRRSGGGDWGPEAESGHVAPQLAYSDSRGRERERICGLFDGQRTARRNDSDGCGSAQLADSDSARGDSGGPRRAGQDGRSVAEETSRVMADANDERREEREPASEPGDEGRHGWRGAWPPGPDDMHAWRAVQAGAQPSICRMAHGLPRGVGRRRAKLKALGNAVVPAVAEVVGRRVAEILRGDV